ncbi:RNA polymerase sigma factor [Tenacibaculum xiamenense]|uniref:RNA polymerase sigma factor n=1 Tax=Tenacibaculum xiamenense TaxID=1261553 RepID=UPI003892F5E2
MELKQLIQLCKRKDFKAQELLYRRYSDILFHLSLKYCKNREEAQDNLQDSFIEILNNINKYKNKGSFKGWIKRNRINL